MDIELRDDPDQLRFDLLVDGVPAGFAAYRVRDGVTVITHSEVDPELRGRGLGTELARRTLDRLVELRAPVIPACPFFAAFVADHPEYQEIVHR